MPELQLAQLVDTKSPQAVWMEAQTILELLPLDFDVELVRMAFETAVNLYHGQYPGFQACSTPYHDLHHITDVFLAMARLIHGAVLDGQELDNKNILLALTAALFHDSGLIQKKDDREGTGAKYLADHDQRSIDFLKKHSRANGFSNSAITAGSFLIRCTDLSVDVASISFPSQEIELLGKLLAAADLIAQMADHVYLEKLLFLYHEFKEGQIGNYTSEIDLLQKTVEFYDFVAQRLAPIQEMIGRFARLHFKKRWQIDVDLYQEALDNQKQYLQYILRQESDPRDYLRQQDIVQQVRQIYGEASAQT